MSEAREMLIRLRDRNNQLEAELTRRAQESAVLQKQIAAGKGYIEFLKAKLDKADPEWRFEPQPKQEEAKQ
jgi:hypothetical protein